MVNQYPLSAPASAKKSSVAMTAAAFTPTDNHQKVEKSMKNYQVAQQVEYLHLQAEIDVLLQKLQSLSKQPSKSDYVSSRSDR